MQTQGQGRFNLKLISQLSNFLDKVVPGMSNLRFQAQQDQRPQRFKTKLCDLDLVKVTVT